MSIIDFKINKNLLDLKFEGYKLSLDPIPVLKQPAVDGVKIATSENEDYSYLQTRMTLLLNMLYQDPWAQNSVFYVNEKNNIIWTQLGQDERLSIPRCVWNIPKDEARTQTNITISFPGSEWAVLCRGTNVLHILYTPSRAAGEPWMSYHTFNMDVKSSSYVLHSVHRSTPSGQQIDCIVATVEKKSDFVSEIVAFSEDCNFVSVLHWISCVCGIDNQSWSLKRTRKLASSSFPDYVAIDDIGDALCIVSESDFTLYYDSDRPVYKVNNNGSNTTTMSSKYTYIQSHEDIAVHFRLPEGIKKSDVQINILSSSMEISIQGKVVLCGQLANFIDTDGSTWTIEKDRIEMVLSKREIGLMWSELLKGNKEGEEILDPELITEINSRLAHLTSDSEVSLNNGSIPFNLEQLEECDSSSEYHAFQRIDGNGHSETHRINMGGHQWLFSTQICSESLPAICLRHNVDGILWQPKNTCIEGEIEQFRVEHIATFSALGYVSASNQDKKFMSCSPDFKHAVISDCSRHLYVYCQPEDLNSTFELRNRKTGVSVAHIAKQYVISLEDSDRILGLKVSPQCIFVLSKNSKSSFQEEQYTLYAAKIGYK